jgi:hypothetical protein
VSNGVDPRWLGEECNASCPAFRLSLNETTLMMGTEMPETKGSMTNPFDRPRGRGLDTPPAGLKAQCSTVAGGFVCRLWRVSQFVYVTGVYPTRGEARAAALEWAWDMVEHHGVDFKAVFNKPLG